MHGLTFSALEAGGASLRGSESLLVMLALHGAMSLIFGTSRLLVRMLGVYRGSIPRHRPIDNLSATLSL